MNKITHPIEPEELMAFLDGELAEDACAEVEAHVKECVSCRTLAAEIRAVSQRLHTWTVEPLPSDIPQPIDAALATLDAPAAGDANRRHAWLDYLPHRSPSLVWGGALAAVILVMIGSVRFIGGNANNVFSQVGSAMSGINETDDTTMAPQSAPAVAARLQTYLESKRSANKSVVIGGVSSQSTAPLTKSSSSSSDGVPSGPMIIRTAELSLVTKEFDRARASVELILNRHRGYVGQLSVGGSTGASRTLTARLHVPADQLDSTVADMKSLGRIESESQTGQDVTSQYVDLQARLANARNTSDRLTDLLRNRTGKLSDVLEVEQELDRVRGEIEEMEAERKTMAKQVSFATLNVTVHEDYKAQLQVVPPSTSTRLANAAVNGYKTVVDSVLSLALFLLSTGPILALWAVVLFIPARIAWRKVRRNAESVT